MGTTDWHNNSWAILAAIYKTSPVRGFSKWLRIATAIRRRNVKYFRWSFLLRYATAFRRRNAKCFRWSILLRYAKAIRRRNAKFKIRVATSFRRRFAFSFPLTISICSTLTLKMISAQQYSNHTLTLKLTYKALSIVGPLTKIALRLCTEDVSIHMSASQVDIRFDGDTTSYHVH